jgi:hypothetical protein
MRPSKLRFEVERDPPRAIRFRLAHQGLGEYWGLCRFEEDEERKTTVELATWVQPARPVPLRLLLVVERMMLLKGVREFLDACEVPARPSTGSGLAQ